MADRTRVLEAVLVVALAVMGGGSEAAAEYISVPDPISPNQGEATLLRVVNDKALRELETALDNFPVPYVVIASAGGAEPTLTNKKAGAPVRIDADRDRNTGKGGNDVQVEVNTELAPVPHLVLDIVRLGEPPYAEDLSVIIAFPFDAFNDEVLPAPPNLFLGYETRGEFDAVDDEYPGGGHAPAAVRVRFISWGALAGTDHEFEVTVQTTGADNPVLFAAGHFDGARFTGTHDALAVTATADPVPDEFRIDLRVGNTPLFQPTFDTSVGLGWTASQPSRVTFAYLEHEGFPFETPHFDTEIVFDRMPVTESLQLEVDTETATAMLAHEADAVIDAVSLRHMRADRLTVLGVATDVPTLLELDVDLTGSAALDVNANTLDLSLELMEEPDGFPGTDDFLGYDLGYVALGLGDAPDLEAGYFPSTHSFRIESTNPGECAGCGSIGKVELVLDDDGRYDDGGVLQGLELPPSWTDQPTHVIFSLADDGTHGTAAARGRDVVVAEYDLDPGAAPSERFQVELTAPAPVQAYLKTLPDSSLIPNHDIEATCDVDVFPAGEFDFEIEFPVKLDYCNDREHRIEELHCFGHLDTLNFDILGRDLPPCLSFELNPESDATLEARSDAATPNSDRAGVVAVRLWDELGPGLPGSSLLFDAPLRDARFRVDDAPSMQGAWFNDGVGGTGVAFDAGVPIDPALHLGGAQVLAQTEAGSPEFPEASPDSVHVLGFTDRGPAQLKRLLAEAFGITHASYLETASPRSAAVAFRADGARGLVLTVDSGFGGRFFPSVDLEATVVLEDAPARLDLTTDLATDFTLTASDGLDELSLTAEIDTTDDGADDGTRATLLVAGIPDRAALDVEPTGLTLTMDRPIDSIVLQAESATGVLGSEYKQVGAHIAHVPANWTATWSETGATVAALGDKVEEISLIVSTRPADRNAASREPFRTGGGDVRYTAFTREIDRRWAAAGEGADREQQFMSRLDGLYGSTHGLDVDEDRLLKRKGRERVAGRSTIGEGDGSTATFTGVLSAPVVASTVVVRVGGIEGVDDGDGNIVGTGIDAGTIDYGSGEVSLTLGFPPAAGSPIVVDYEFRQGFEYYELKMQDLQSLSLDLSGNGAEVHAEIPFDDDAAHPFYIGLGYEDGKFETVQIEDLPDVIDMSVVTSPIVVGFESSDGAGRIDYYAGPLPSAGLSDDVTKLTLVAAPTDLTLLANVGGTIGLATFESDTEVDVRVLSQGGGSRVVGALKFRDLLLSYTTTVLQNEVEDECWDAPSPDPTDPVEEFCNEYLEFVGATVSLDSVHGIGGMLLTYDLAEAEDANGITPDGNQYIPDLSFLFEDVTSISGSVHLRMCVVPTGAPPCIPGLVAAPALLSFDGDANLDFWDRGDPEVLLEDPDYVDNDPWPILPFPYDFEDRINPFE